MSRFGSGRRAGLSAGGGRAGGGRAGRYALAAAVLVPMVVAGVQVWSGWNPDQRLNRVHAAVVNQDQLVTMTGQDGKQQVVLLGRLLAGQLVGDTGDDNLTWDLTDDQDARSGLADGRYAAVVSIPKDFSAKAVSTAGSGPPQQATATLRTDDANGDRSGDIARSVALAAVTAINTQVTRGYLGNVYLGFGGMRQQIGQAAGGADQLAGGAGQLAGGVDQLTGGATQLAGGLGQLAGGAGALSSGLGQMNAQAAAMPGQARMLDDGAGQVAVGTQTLAAQAGQLVDGAGNVEGGAGYLSSGLGRSSTLLRDLSAQCAASGASAAYCAQLGQAAGAVGSLAGTASNLRSGAQFVRSRAQQLHAVGGQLATGAAGLHQGTSALATGLPALSSGITAAASGARQLSSGTTLLASGARQLSSGTSRFASGLQAGATSVPSYDAKQRSELSTAVATPVVADVVRQHEVKGGDSGAAPYVMALALWIGALAIYLLVRPLSGRALASTASTARVALAGYLPGAVVATVQALLMVAILVLGVGMHAALPFALIAVAVLTGLAFAALNQALTATFGTVGRYLSLVLAAVQFAAAGAVQPIGTAPEPLRVLHDLLPLSYAADAMRVCVTGGGTGLWPAVTVLTLWTLGALLVTVAAARRQRAWTPLRVHAAAVA